MFLKKQSIISVICQVRIRRKACNMHFSNIDIGMSDGGNRGLAKHVKTMKENAC